MRGNENVFSDDLERVAPPSITKFRRLLFVIVDLRIVAGEANIIRQRVEPDIGHEILVERQLNSPIEPRFRTRDTEVATDSLNRIPQFGSPKIGNDRVFAIVDVTKQPVFVLTQFEIIIFFFPKLDLSPLRPKLAVRSAFLVSEKLFLTN